MHRFLTSLGNVYKEFDVKYMEEGRHMWYDVQGRWRRRDLRLETEESRLSVVRDEPNIDQFDTRLFMEVLLYTQLVGRVKHKQKRIRSARTKRLKGGRIFFLTEYIKQVSTSRNVNPSIRSWSTSRLRYDKCYCIGFRL